MQNKVLKNISWIVVCKLCQSLFGLIISMISARYLGPSNYGLINYAASIVSFAVPIMQLGLKSTLVNEIINHPQNEGKVLGTSVCMTMMSACTCMIGIATFVSVFDKGETETIVVCILYSLNLIAQAFEMVQYWYQAKLLSKYSSLISLGAYLCVSIYKIILLITGKNVYWFALSQALDYLIISIGMYYLYKVLGGQKLSFSFQLAKDLFSRSKYYIISSMMVIIFSQTDKFMLKSILNAEAVGLYSAAATIANMFAFLYLAIIDSMRPIILSSKKKNVYQYEENISKLFCIIFYISLLQCLFMTIFAEQIVLILYGKEFQAAGVILKILVWYMTYSYFGSVRNIWILAENKQKYLLKINLIGVIINVIFNFLLIPIAGPIGASVASVLTQFIINFGLGFIFEPIKECNRLIIKGLKIRFLKEKILSNIRI